MLLFFDVFLEKLRIIIIFRNFVREKNRDG